MKANYMKNALLGAALIAAAGTLSTCADSYSSASYGARYSTYGRGFDDNGFRSRGDWDGDRIPNRYDFDRDGDGVSNRFDWAPNDSRRR